MRFKLRNKVNHIGAILMIVVLIFIGCSCGLENNSKYTTKSSDLTTSTSTKDITLKTQSTTTTYTTVTSISSKSNIKLSQKKSFKRAKKPEIVFPKLKYIICSTETEPFITLKADKGSDIYYTVNGKEPSEKSLKYTKPIQINRYKKNEIILGFTLKAFSKKKGYLDSKVLEMDFIFDHATSDSGGDCLESDTPKIGDTVINGKINDNKITKQMKKFAALSVKRNGKKIDYEADIKNGKFKIELDTPLAKGDELWLWGGSTDKVVNYQLYKDENVIHIWEDYYSFYSGKFGRTL